MSDNNYRIAPQLHFKGDKFNYQGVFNAKEKKGFRFYQLPIPLLSFIFSSISGKNGNIIKLLVFLIGSGEGLGISESLVLNRTGLSHQAYCSARKWLIENCQFFIYDKEHKLIVIDFNELWREVDNYELMKLESVENDTEETVDEEGAAVFQKKFSWM